MATTSTAALLDAWDQGRDASPGERALILLGVVHPEMPASTLSTWPVGRRDAALLSFCERLFGPRLAAQAHCPHCAGLLELDVDVARIAAAAPREIAEAYVFRSGGYCLTYRLPSAGDLAALETAGRAGGAPMSRWLLDRCIVAVESDDATVPDQNGTPNVAEKATRSASSAADIGRSIEVPANIVAALESQIAETVAAADPLADIALELVCPACGTAWGAPFDIVRFLWSELDAWALRILDDVHVLASRYGWSEVAILALTPQRRRHYRDLIGL